jgi:hypothetical protein
MTRRAEQYPLYTTDEMLRMFALKQCPEYLTALENHVADSLRGTSIEPYIEYTEFYDPYSRFCQLRTVLNKPLPEEVLRSRPNHQGYLISMQLWTAGVLYINASSTNLFINPRNEYRSILLDEGQDIEKAFRRIDSILDRLIKPLCNELCAYMDDESKEIV